MRPFLLALLVVPTLSVPAQQSVGQSAAPIPPPAGASWQHIQALPAGTSINIKAKMTHTSCKLKSVDADIVNIKVPHRSRSTLIGLAIGAGVGAIVGRAAAGGPCNNFCIINPGAVIAGGAIGFGAIGTVVGALTDFTRSTVYNAP